MVDDGLKIHTLLQSSQFPVVQVALSTVFDGDYEMSLDSNKYNRGNGVSPEQSDCLSRLFLVTADTQACVRTHFETDIDEMENSNGTPYNKIGSGMVTSKSNSKEGEIGSAGRGKRGGGPVTLCGESIFPVPVVSCSFREPLSIIALVQKYLSSPSDDRVANDKVEFDSGKGLCVYFHLIKSNLVCLLSLIFVIFIHSCSHSLRITRIWNHGYY